MTQVMIIYISSNCVTKTKAVSEAFVDMTFFGNELLLPLWGNNKYRHTKNDDDDDDEFV